MASRWSSVLPMVGVLLVSAALRAQVPHYNGIWQVSPPLTYSPLFTHAADRLRIVAQPPGITCEFGAAATAGQWGSPLSGSFGSPTAASASLVIAGGTCTWSFTAVLTFVGPDQLTGTLHAWDRNNCFWWGAIPQLFTAQRAPLGMYETFAVGCPAASAPPVLSAPAPPSLSTGFTATLAGVPANLALLATGLSNTSVGALALPLDLGSYGMNGCRWHVSAESVQLLTGGPTVQSVWTFPGAPALLGATFYQQAWVLAPGANGLGALASQAAVGVIGP